jgi:hypothetical protein
MELKSSDAAIALVFAAVAMLNAPAWPAVSTAARSKACWSESDKKGLRGEARVTFHETCMEGALAPTTPTHHDKGSVSALAVTSPSGQSRTQRSKACAAEANLKAKTENERASIRLTCMANASPPSTTGTPTRTPTPVKSHDELGVLPH